MTDALHHAAKRVKEGRKNALFHSLHRSVEKLAAYSLLWFVPSDDRLIGPNGTEVMITSWLWTQLSPLKRARLRKLPYASWKRIWKAWRSFACSVCLAQADIDGPAEQGLRDLKLWLIRSCLHNEDQGLEFLKFLTKCCFKAAFDDHKGIFKGGNSSYPGYNSLTGKFRSTPFQGSLTWIDQVLKGANVHDTVPLRPPLVEGRPIRFGGVGAEPMTQLVNRYRALAQISVTGRALPYPSRNQIASSVQKVIQVTNKSGRLSPSVLGRWKHAVSAASTWWGDPQSSGRLDLANSACFEAGIATGGRGSYVAEQVKTMLKSEISLENLDILYGYDALGRRICESPDEIQLHVITAVLSPEQLDLPPYGEPGLDEIYDNYRDPIEPFRPRLAHVMYQDYAGFLHSTSLKGTGIPKNLGDWVALWALADMRRHGVYDPEPDWEIPFGTGTEPWLRIPVWKSSQSVLFYPEGVFKVRASLSLEAGMKSRVVTAAYAPWIVLNQVARHQVQSALECDQTLRIGIQDSDKLWQLLKQAGKTLQDVELIHSSDLTEATYNIIPDVGNVIFNEMRAKGLSPILEIFQLCYKQWERDVEFTSPDPIDPSLRRFSAKQGSFMGEPMSFMTLSIMLSTISHVASCYMDSEYEYPSNFFEVVRPGAARPFSQTVGDDHFAAARAKYTRTFNALTREIFLVPSDKDGASPSFGTFCENFVCVPRDSNGAPYGGGEFGIFHFLDIVKARLLSGDSKVSADRSSPFLGHAKLLAKQLEWHPLNWIAPVALRLFRAIHPKSSSIVAGCHADFPRHLGGLGLPKLPEHTPEANWKGYFRFIYPLLEADISTYLKWYLLIQSIPAGSTKGFLYELTPKIAETISSLELSEIELESHILPWQVDDALREIAKDCDAVLLEDLHYEVSRYISLNEMLRGKKPSFVTNKVSIFRKKFQNVWALVRRELKPLPEDWIETNSYNEEEFYRNWRSRARRLVIDKSVLLANLSVSLSVDTTPNRTPLGIPYAASITGSGLDHYQSLID